MLSVTGKGKLSGGLLFLLLLGMGVLMLYPFLWMLSVSLERSSNIAVPFPPRIIPEQFSIFNYKLVFENGVLFKTYANSAIISLFSVILSVSSAPAGFYYAFSRGNSEARNSYSSQSWPP